MGDVDSTDDRTGTALTPADLEDARLSDILSEAELTRCEDFFPLLGQRLSSTLDNLAPRTRRLLELLRDISSPMLSSTDDVTSFQPYMQTTKGRTILPSDLEPTALSDLAAIARALPNSELRARALDILWMRRKDWLGAQDAVIAYLDSAESLIAESWPDAGLRIKRAAGLSRSLGRKSGDFAVVRAHILGLLDRLSSQDGTLYLSIDLLTTLRGQRDSDPGGLAERCRQLMYAAARGSNWEACRELLLVEASFWRQAKDSHGAEDATIRAAATYIFQAMSSITGERRSYFLAVDRLAKALDLVRNLPSSKDCRESLHRVLLDFQVRSLDEFGRITSRPNVDITALVDQAIGQVAGHSREDAIVAVAFLTGFQSVATLRAEAEHSVAQFPLRSMIRAVHVDARGRTVAQREPLFSGDQTQQEAGLEALMFERLDLGRRVDGAAVLEPVMERLSLEHGSDGSLFEPWLRENVFIPPDRIALYASGFAAGLRGDRATSTHLLVPQLENSLRHLLARDGIVTSSLDEQGIQREFDLSKLLSLSEITDRLGPDAVFAMRGLLTEAIGPAVRHGVAHGLLGSDDFKSPQHAYLWWLVLHLVVNFRLGRLPYREGESAPQEAVPEIERGSTR